jgi:hypothetical protein
MPKPTSQRMANAQQELAELEKAEPAEIEPEQPVVIQPQEE